MNDQDFELLIKKIQGEVFDEAKEALGEKGFERWRNPKYCGIPKEADSYARLRGDCGDTMAMYISVEDGRVTKVSYITDGCSSSSIAGSFAAEIAMGKRFEEVLDLRGEDVLRVVGHFPKGEEHCAHLAVRTLQEALNSYLIRKTKKHI